MRSELVFATTKTTSNRFALCHQVFRGTRKLHKTASLMATTINDVFTFFARQEEVVVPPAEAPTLRTILPGPTEAKVAA